MAKEEKGCKGKCDGECASHDKPCLAKLIDNSGTVVGMYSPECDKWLSEHEDCIGCLFELGCKKYHALMQIQKNTNDAIQRLINIGTMAEFEKFAEEFGEKEE